jgi:hypothetical protein
MAFCSSFCCWLRLPKPLGSGAEVLPVVRLRPRLLHVMCAHGHNSYMQCNSWCPLLRYAAMGNAKNENQAILWSVPYTAVKQTVRLTFPAVRFCAPCANPKARQIRQTICLAWQLWPHLQLQRILILHIVCKSQHMSSFALLLDLLILLNCF